MERQFEEAFNNYNINQINPDDYYNVSEKTIEDLQKENKNLRQKLREYDQERRKLEDIITLKEDDSSKLLSKIKATDNENKSLKEICEKLKKDLEKAKKIKSEKQKIPEKNQFSNFGSIIDKLITERKGDNSILCFNFNGEGKFKEKGEFIGKKRKEAEKKTKKAKKEKKVGDIKRPTSSYIYYWKERVKEIKKDKPNCSQLIAEIAREWKEMSQDKKMVWNQLAKNDKERYEREKKSAELNRNLNLNNNNLNNNNSQNNKGGDVKSNNNI